MTTTTRAARLRLLGLGVALLLGSGLAWLLLGGDLDRVQAVVGATGAWGPPADVALHVLLTLVPVSKNLLSAVAGALFGLAGGIALLWVASMVSAVVTFPVARRLGRPAVAAMTGPRIDRVEAVLRDDPVVAVIVARLTPVLPFTIVNYGAGVSAVSMRGDFVLGTAVGILPGTLIGYAALGASAGRDATTFVVAGAVAAVLLGRVGAGGATACRLLRRGVTGSTGTQAAPGAPGAQRRRRDGIPTGRPRAGGPVGRVHGVERAVGGRAGLDAPPLGQQAQVDDVVPDLVEDRADHLLGRGVVTREGQRAALGVGSRAGQFGQVPEEDGVEALHDPGVGEVGLHQLAARRRLVLELRHHPVALGVVVRRVDDDPAGQGIVREVGTSAERHGDDDDVPGSGGPVRRRGPGVRPELLDEVGECVRPAAVAQDDVVAGADRQARDGAAEMSAADQAPGRHAGGNTGGR